MSAPVFAQGNVITIIRDDGTQDVIPLGGEDVRKDKKSVVLKKEPQADLPSDDQRLVPPAQRIEEVAPLPASELEPAPAQESVKMPVETTKARVAEEVQPRPLSKPAAEKRAVSLSQQDMVEFVPKPQRKPQQRMVDVSIAEPLTQSQALNIALADAPPAKDFKVSVNDEGGALLYSVVFRTDDGQYEIVVDAQSGLITRSGYIGDGQTSVKPGHLPVR
ncbi:MAG: PepSY domain-containing protein [Bdellovibrionales bacterium]